MNINEPEQNYKTGYIKIFRSLKRHWIWQDPVKLKWWLDILLEVNHAPNKVNIKFELFECNRGQSVKSLETWAKEWRTDKSSVKRFFDLLHKDKMIICENLKKTTRITVCNYDSYNGDRNATETQQKRNAFQDETQRNTNKNVKEYNNDKKGKKVFTPPLVEDVVLYFKENGYGEIAARKAHSYYETNNWKDSKDNPVKNWKQKMISVWFKDENKERNHKQPIVQREHSLPTPAEIMAQRNNKTS